MWPRSRRSRPPRATVALTVLLLGIVPVITSAGCTSKARQVPPGLKGPVRGQAPQKLDTTRPVAGMPPRR
jgi:hypothetical protein